MFSLNYSTPSRYLSITETSQREQAIGAKPPGFLTAGSGQNGHIVLLYIMFKNVFLQGIETDCIYIFKKMIVNDVPSRTTNRTHGE